MFTQLTLRFGWLAHVHPNLCRLKVQIKHKSLAVASWFAAVWLTMILWTWNWILSKCRKVSARYAIPRTSRSIYKRVNTSWPKGKNSSFFTLNILFAINPARCSTLAGRAFPNFKRVYQRIQKGCIARTSSSRPSLPPLLLYLLRISRLLLPRMLLKGTAFVVHFRPAFLIPSVHVVRRGVILQQIVSLPAG